MASVKRSKPKKKFFTVEEANATLPLLRAILRDVTSLARDLRDRDQRRLRLQSAGSSDSADEREMQQLDEEIDRGQDQMQEYVDELRKLHVELKDYFTGLIDFPCWMDDREVYLCWKLDEPEVSHWHELDSGFSGRQKLKQKVLN
jgi:hypothetical protein